MMDQNLQQPIANRSMGSNQLGLPVAAAAVSCYIRDTGAAVPKEMPRGAGSRVEGADMAGGCRVPMVS